MNFFSNLKFFLIVVIFPGALFAQEKVINLGAVLSLTGIASAHGNAIRDGLEFAKSELERTGWKVKIHYEDDATEPKYTVSAVERLANTGTRFFVGPTWGILAIPAAPVFARKKAISLQPCNSSDFVSGVNDRYFFFFTPPSKSEDLIVDFLRPHRGQPVAIVNNISTWGELWQQIFKRAVERAGAKLVIDEMIQFSDAQGAIPSIVSRIKREGVAVVLSTTTKEATALTIANLEKQQTRAKVLSPDLIDSIMEDLTPRNTQYVEGYTVTPIQNKSFIGRFTSWKGRAPWKYTDSGYDTLMALAAAIDKVGNDPEAVKNYFENTIDFAGAAGRIKFNASHDVEGSGYEIVRLVSPESY